MPARNDAYVLQMDAYVDADWGESIQHYPSGDINSAGDTITACIGYADLSSGTGMDGDGRRPSNDRGVSVRSVDTISIDAGIEINEESGLKPSSLFVIANEQWRAKRRISRDNSKQLIEIVRIDKKLTRQATRQ